MKIAKDIYIVGSGQIRLSNPMDCHVYLVDGGDELALIDAGVGYETDLIIDNIRQDGLDQRKIKSLLLTHCHSDHAGGCKGIKERLGCQVIVPELEDRILEEGSDQELGLDITKRSGIYPKDYVFPHCKVDRTVRHGDKIQVGKYEVTVIQVPGHSKGSSCLLLEQNGYKIVFSSDIVFLGGTIGLGNWPGSSLDDYRRSISRLANLSVDGLLPGHFLWTLKGGQDHINKAIEALSLAWVPPLWQHQHPAF